MRIASHSCCPVRCRSGSAGSDLPPFPLAVFCGGADGPADAVVVEDRHLAEVPVRVTVAVRVLEDDEVAERLRVADVLDDGVADRDHGRAAVGVDVDRVAARNPRAVLG